MRLKNWWKREDSALRAGICKARGSIDPMLLVATRLVVSWVATRKTPKVGRCGRPMTGADSSRGVSVSGIPNADASHQCRNPAGWQFVTSIRFPPISFDPKHIFHLFTKASYSARPSEVGSAAAIFDPDLVGESELAAAVTLPQTRPRTKGVADVVFLIDASGSMGPMIDAVRKNINAFVDSLSSGDANNAPLEREWRGTVVGYRDILAAESEGTEWLEYHPLIRDTAALKAQLAGLRARGGDDEPESPPNALYKIASMEASPEGAQSEEASKGRYRSDAARVAVVFTDAWFKETMSILEAKDGALGTPAGWSGESLGPTQRSGHL